MFGPCRRVAPKSSRGLPHGRRAGLATIASNTEHEPQPNPRCSTSDAHHPLARRGQATPEEIGELVRRTAAQAYGVLSVGGQRWYDRLLALVGRRRRGVRVQLQPLRIELNLRVAPGLPAAAVADNVEEAVRYTVQRDLGRAIDQLTVHVEDADPPVGRGAADGTSGR